MYIALYDENRRHITNVDNVTYDKTVRVYDPDSFSAEGTSSEDINNAKVVVVNDDAGNYRYACFADTVTPDKNKRTIKGLDFKTLWDTEILLDYTAEDSFNGSLSAIFTKIKMLVFGGTDATAGKIPVRVVIPNDNTDTTTIYGSYQGTYQLVNAYSFLKCYLKYYEYNIDSAYDILNGEIVFTFTKCTSRVTINLSDFIHELTTASSTTNKVVATIKYNVQTPATDTNGNIVYTSVQEVDESGNPKVDENGNPVYVPKYKPRPSSIATRYYYRDKDNNIAEGDAAGNYKDSGEPIENRIYPVRTKWFESEYLADAQFEAVYELANARYIDNIVIDNNITIDPINFADYPVYTKVDLYYDGKLYKTLPISEKITTLDSGGENTKIKLGFKKILLTEIIKG